MHIGIIGAGIGGLTLAQALYGKNIKVTVYDCDSSPLNTGGYRLHISEQALNSIRKVLPSHFYHALRSSGTGRETSQHFSIIDHKGKTKLKFLATAEDEDLLMIGRKPLRKILAEGLETVLRWGIEFSHYEEVDSGVIIHFQMVKVRKLTS
ncbi:hypothetical protein WQ57_23120 [Mesobacillus campisalis]|uniref:FAD-binding domain-containing protein n=1 Tax=Mesobacillus campisalis TaxID=1408103 RepID=A0A0M2SNI5_9BACI|nr:NAD(P)-binding protein [Mesobacillus campisalis]KKK34442.1 hypothetical protein WQ57_23120 [Mesobacillus campisalis]